MSHSWEIELNTQSSISTRVHAYMYYSRRHTCGIGLISLHTHFIFILLFSTVTYSIEVYGPDTAAENIILVSIRNTGEDGARTENKRLTDRTTEVRGYYMNLLYYTAFFVGWQNVPNHSLWLLPCGQDGAIMPHLGLPTVDSALLPYKKIHYWPHLFGQDCWILASFSFFCDFKDLDSVSVHKHAKKNQANIQASWQNKPGQ